MARIVLRLVAIRWCVFNGGPCGNLFSALCLHPASTQPPPSLHPASTKPPPCLDTASTLSIVTFHRSRIPHYFTSGGIYENTKWLFLCCLKKAFYPIPPMEAQRKALRVKLSLVLRKREYCYYLCFCFYFSLLYSHVLTARRHFNPRL